MARTILQMLTSGDVIINHPGKHWAFTITNGRLPEEDFKVLMAYSIENHPSQKAPAEFPERVRSTCLRCGVKAVTSTPLPNHHDKLSCGACGHTWSVDRWD